jgi:hypothetical protein
MSIRVQLKRNLWVTEGLAISITWKKKYSNSRLISSVYDISIDKSFWIRSWKTNNRVDRYSDPTWIFDKAQHVSVLISLFLDESLKQSNRINRSFVNMEMLFSLLLLNKLPIILILRQLSSYDSCYIPFKILSSILWFYSFSKLLNIA